MTPQQRLARLRALLAIRPTPTDATFRGWLIEAVSVFHNIADPTLAAKLVRTSESGPDRSMIEFLDSVDPAADLATDLAQEAAAAGGQTAAKIRADAEAAYARQAELLAAEARELEAERQAQLAQAEQVARFETLLDDARAAEQANRLDQKQSELIRVKAEDRDRKVEALTRLLAGTRGGYPSLLTAYADVTGASVADPLDAGSWKRAHRYGSAEDRAHESIATATWGQVMGDSVARRLVDVYQTSPGVQAWRAIASDIVTGADFRTQRFTRTGGYGTLPIVAQGAPYQALPTPTDEGATTAVAKRGGTEKFTFESFVNGEIDAVRRAISQLGRAAAGTLNRAVLDVLTTNAATTYDGVTLFHASHSNTGAGALAAPTLSAARKAMRKQASLSDPDDIIGAVPRYLVVPADLEELAYQLCATPGVPPSDDGIDSARMLYEPVTPIIAAHWTTTTAWYVVANPQSVPTIAVAFAGPTDDPEFTMYPDPNTDAVWIKIRHPWGIAVLDHRGFQSA